MAKRPELHHFFYPFFSMPLRSSGTAVLSLPGRYLSSSSNLVMGAYLPPPQSPHPPFSKNRYPVYLTCTSHRPPKMHLQLPEMVLHDVLTSRFPNEPVSAINPRGLAMPLCSSLLITERTRSSMPLRRIRGSQIAYSVAFGVTYHRMRRWFMMSSQRKRKWSTLSNILAIGISRSRPIS